MTTITGLTAARMIEIEDASIVDGEVVSGNLILTKHDGTTINAGPVLGPAGSPGPAGPSGVSSIPGEIKMWSGTVLPLLATFGKWVWADGAVYANATYPLAAANIGTQWRTFAGASDPGGSNFRVPDLRGLVPAGLDAMPGGTRANRMTRALAIILAGKTGEETHVITINEVASHQHNLTDPGHTHGVNDPTHVHGGVIAGSGPTEGGGSFAANTPTNTINTDAAATGIGINAANTGISVLSNGGGAAHENVQPTVFIPYIVKLDG